MIHLSELITVASSVVPDMDVYSGYPATSALPPYVTLKPLTMTPTDIAICGDATAWDSQFTASCTARSAEAADNLARDLAQSLQGRPLAGCTLACSVAYSGALVEGLYESLVTIQINEGGN